MVTGSVDVDIGDGKVWWEVMMTMMVVMEVTIIRMDEADDDDDGYDFFFQGNFAHAGFPEIAFGRYSDTLIQKGYK